MLLLGKLCSVYSGHNCIVMGSEHSPVNCSSCYNCIIILVFAVRALYLSVAR